MRLNRLLRGQPFRIGLRYAVLFAASMVLVGGITLWRLTDTMDADLRASVLEESSQLQAVYRQEGWDALADEVAIESSLSAGSDDVRGTHYLLLDRRGEKVAGDLNAIQPFRGWGSTTLTGRDDADPDPNDDPDVVAVTLHGTELPEGWLITGISRHGIDEMQDTVLSAGVWGATAGVLLALLGGVLMSRTSLRWVDAVNQTIDQIMRRNLSRRLPDVGAGRDLDELTRNINRMLDRIEELMEGLRQVTNDIAHDLRTPLSRLKQTLEQAIARVDEGSESSALLAKSITETQSILATFDALLRIAEIEAGARRAKFTEVDLAELAEEIAETYRPVAEDRGQRLQTEIEAGTTLNGDRDLLAQLLVNLVENAIQYAGADSTVHVVVSGGAAGTAEIAVIDNGPGIPAPERARVVERFYRLQKSRTAPGSGLGLALVKAIAELHHRRLILADNRPGLAARVLLL